MTVRRLLPDDLAGVKDFGFFSHVRRNNYPGDRAVYQNLKTVIVETGLAKVKIRVFMTELIRLMMGKALRNSAAFTLRQRDS
jgi:hypothetical protein